MGPTSAQLAPAQSRWTAVWAHVRARKWKLLGIALAYGLGRSCPLWPGWAHPACELLGRLVGALP